METNSAIFTRRNLRKVKIPLEKENKIDYPMPRVRTQKITTILFPYPISFISINPFRYL